MEVIINAIILGIIQGLTEFLPVSSSGHLEIAEAILGENKKEDMLMTIVLHFATALATSTEKLSTLVLGKLIFKSGNLAVKASTIGTMRLWSVVLKESKDNSS